MTDAALRRALDEHAADINAEHGRQVVVSVPGRPPGGNELHRMNHWAVTKERQFWRESAYLATLVAPRLATPMDRATIAIEWRCKSKRRRDFDNLISGIKPLLDGLVDAGVIRDDSTDCLVEIGPLTCTSGWDRDETILTVNEVKG